MGKKDFAAKMVARPVLEYLSEQNPDKMFNAYFSEYRLPDGPCLFFSNIYQTGPGVLRSFLPKKIASIMQLNIHTPEFSIYDEKLISYEKLEELLKEINIFETWEKHLPPRPTGFIERIGDWLEEIGS